MTALLGAAILFAVAGTLMYGARPRLHPGAFVVVRPAGVTLIGLAGLIAATVMYGQMAGITL